MVHSPRFSDIDKPFVPMYFKIRCEDQHTLDGYIPLVLRHDIDIEFT